MEAGQHLQKQDHPKGRREDSPLLFPGLLIFVLLSGATALVYEVVWVRMLILRLARIMHRFLSRSDESADLTRRATEAPANVLYGTLRRPTERTTRSGRMISSVQ